MRMLKFRNVPFWNLKLIQFFYSEVGVTLDKIWTEYISVILLINSNVRQNLN